jgi:hypothetical protein
LARSKRATTLVSRRRIFVFMQSLTRLRKFCDNSVNQGLVHHLFQLRTQTMCA